MTNYTSGSAPPNHQVRGYTLAMRCSIVIRAYNESRHLGRLLEGIACQTCQDVEVILVDSGSTDATVEIAESYGSKIVRIQPGEFTFGRSLNHGVQAASSDLIVIASAHVFPVYPDWIESLLRPFADRDVAVVYGKQRDDANSQFSERQVFFQWFPDADIPDQASPFCNNANAAIRRSLWEQHPYDETLTGLEDVEWAKWAQSRRGRIYYSAHAEVIHLHQETPKGVYDRYRREAMAFKRIFPESHFSIYDCVRLAATNILTDLARCMQEDRAWRKAASIWWFRGAQFWGTYQGYRHSSPVTQELRQRFYYPASGSVPPGNQSNVQPIRYNEAAVPPESGHERPE